MGRLGDLARVFRAMVTDTPDNFGWIMEGLAASGKPSSKRQLNWLRNQGIRAILSLTEEALPTSWLEGLDLEYLHLPMKDHAAPPLDSLAKAVEFINSMRNNNKPVLVHCGAGLGRTGTVLAAYLVASKGLKAEEAIKVIRGLRRGSIESSQEVAVYKFAEMLEGTR